MPADLFESGLHLIPNHDVRGAALRGERRVHGHILLLGVVFPGRQLQAHVVDQTQVHDIDRNLRVIALLQSIENFPLV